MGEPRAPGRPGQPGEPADGRRCAWAATARAVLQQASRHERKRHTHLPDLTQSHMVQNYAGQESLEKAVLA